MDNNPNYITSPSNAVKRSRNPEQWKKHIPRKKRNLGEEYNSYSTGKLIPKRSMGDPCGCTRLKCFENICENNRQKIFSEFWSTGSHLIQTSFIQNHVQQNKPKHHRTADLAKQRKCSRTYFLKSSDGNNVCVCLKAFCSILGETERRVKYACDAMMTESGEFFFKLDCCVVF